MAKAGKQSSRRGGSNGKVSPQKVVLSPKGKSKVSYKKTDYLKRDARHVIHHHKYKDGVFKFSHTDVNHTDSNGKVTRSINMRGGH